MRWLSVLIVGLILTVGCKPETTQSSPTPPVRSSGTTAGSVSQAEDFANASAVKLVSIEVPGMSCPFSCWPKVKDTLEKQPGVDMVELAKQADENAIDTPIVHVHLKGDFNSNHALSALTKAGFDGSKILHN